MTDTQAQKPAAVPDPFELLWRWLNSLPIAISVMLALAVLSALGTVIPQEHLAQPPMGQTFVQMLIERYGVSRADVIMKLGFHHIYFTWYFFALLLWLSVSAVVCNITRFKRTWHRWRMPIDKSSDRYSGKQALRSEQASDEQVQQLLGLLHAKRFRVREETDDSGVRYVYADSGFLKLWGLVLLHAAILILLIGGVYGKSVGVDGMIRLADGEEKQLVTNPAEHKHPFVKPLLRNLKPLVYDLHQQEFKINYDRKISVPAEISQHVPEPMQEYYMYFVKDFVSHLAVTAERTGQTKEQDITVNHPLIIDKMNFYQSSYQQQGYLDVKVDGRSYECQLLPQQRMYLGPDGGYVESNGNFFSLSPGDDFSVVNGVDANSLAIVVCDQIKAGDLYVKGKLSGYLGPMTTISTGMMGFGMTGQQVITPDKGAEVRLPDGQIAYVRMSKRVDNYSVFSYKRDPGIPLLYFGWIAMIVGVTLALYIQFTQVRMRIEGRQVSVLLSGAGRGSDSPLYQRIHAMLFPS